MVAAPSEIREIPEGSVGGEWRRIGTRASHCPRLHGGSGSITDGLFLVGRSAADPRSFCGQRKAL